MVRLAKMVVSPSSAWLMLVLACSIMFSSSSAFTTNAGIRNGTRTQAEDPFMINLRPSSEEESINKPASDPTDGLLLTTSNPKNIGDKTGKSLLTSITSAWKDRLSSFFNPGSQQKNERRDAFNKEAADKEKESDREARFLNLFTVIRFNNTECRSESGDNGTCYTANECIQKGGIVGGSCAGDFGVCCLFLKTCGENTTANNTYFVNANYPSTASTPGSCQLVVHKCAPDVCQLRLDFLQMKIGGPSVEERTFGQCLDDQFYVAAGASSTTPIICGDNTGQHTNAGCLQWHMGVAGRLESFNFNSARGRQLSNQDYSVCVRPEAGFCGIRYSQCVDNFSRFTRSFTVTGNAGPPDETAANQPARVSEVSEFCALGTDKDWVTIPCGTNRPQYNIETNTAGSFCPDRFCGTVINPVAGQNVASQIYSNRKPFVVYYHTDEAEVGSVGNVGFCLDYVQQPCGASTSG